MNGLNSNNLRGCTSIFREFVTSRPVTTKKMTTTYPFINFGDTSMDTLAFPKLPLMRLTYPLMSKYMSMTIPVEVTEDDTKYIIELKAHGVNEDDVIVELDDDNLLIIIQSPKISYQRVIGLDDNIMDLDNISAFHETNKIVIEIPKILKIPKKKRVILGKSSKHLDITDDLY